MDRDKEKSKKIMKKEYRSPQLTEYGSVAEITATLGGSGADGGSDGNMRTK